MPHPVYLHVGPPKTGSTYIQQLLWLNRQNLLEQGISLAGDNRLHHFHAACDLLGRSSSGFTREQMAGRWGEFCALIRAHVGPVIVSEEALSAAPEEIVDRVLADLAGRDVHVIMTARNARALHESQYQEGVKGGQTWSLEEFIATAIPAGPVSETAVGRSSKTIRTWGAAVAPERFHVVTMPAPGSPRTLLFERFCEVIGFDPSEAILETARVNESIGVVEAELLRRLNSSRDGEWSVQARQYVRHTLVPQVLAGRDGQRKIRVQDPAVLQTLLEQTRLMVTRIDESGFDVVGDLAELETAQVAMSSSPTGTANDSVSDAELIELAVESLRWFAVRATERRHERKLLREQLRTLRMTHRRRVRKLQASRDDLRASRDKLRGRLASAREPSPPVDQAKPEWRRAAVAVARRTRLLGPVRRLRNRATHTGGD